MIALLFACSTPPQRAPHPEEPMPLGEAECAVCGMDLAGQPAPRGQAAYRGGQHRFACSIGDLRALLQTPSPLGAPTAIWVEQDTDPSRITREAQPWLRAEEAWFVFGVDRPEVMGLPALAFPDHASARHAAEALGAEAIPWQLLRDTPFHERPTHEHSLEKR